MTTCINYLTLTLNYLIFKRIFLKSQNFARCPMYFSEFLINCYEIFHGNAIMNSINLHEINLNIYFKFKFKCKKTFVTFFNMIRNF